jgi:hypothetical protein
VDGVMNVLVVLEGRIGGLAPGFESAPLMILHEFTCSLLIFEMN